jgi:hypothetical protein
LFEWGISLFRIHDPFKNIEELSRLEIPNISDGTISCMSFIDEDLMIICNCEKIILFNYISEKIINKINIDSKILKILSF